MKNTLLACCLAILLTLPAGRQVVSLVAPVLAQEAGPAAELTIQVEPNDEIVQPPAERLPEFEELLRLQSPGNLFLNPIKHAIRNAASSGVSLETIVLLILLPAVASFIAAARHLVGLRGFGIFLPAALSVVFVAIGPVLGLGLFLLIVTASTLFRLFLRRFRPKFSLWRPRPPIWWETLSLTAHTSLLPSQCKLHLLLDRIVISLFLL